MGLGSGLKKSNRVAPSKEGFIDGAEERVEQLRPKTTKKKPITLSVPLSTDKLLNTLANLPTEFTSSRSEVLIAALKVFNDLPDSEKIYYLEKIKLG